MGPGVDVPRGADAGRHAAVDAPPGDRAAGHAGDVEGPAVDGECYVALGESADGSDGEGGCAGGGLGGWEGVIWGGRGG